jgi:hypothetical protein
MSFVLPTQIIHPLYRGADLIRLAGHAVHVQRNFPG